MGSRCFIRRIRLSSRSRPTSRSKRNSPGFGWPTTIGSPSSSWSTTASNEGSVMANDLLSVDEALAKLLAGARPTGDVETIPTLKATGRVLARPQVSALNVPPLDNTSMDGYAVRTADCASGETRLSIAQRIPAGAVGKALALGIAARIFTGVSILSGVDAVVPQEQCTVDGDHVVIKDKPQPGDWIRRAGEDIR